MPLGHRPASASGERGSTPHRPGGAPPRGHGPGHRRRRANAGSGTARRPCRRRRRDRTRVPSSNGRSRASAGHRRDAVGRGPRVAGGLPGRTRRRPRTALPRPASRQRSRPTLVRSGASAYYPTDEQHRSAVNQTDPNTAKQSEGGFDDALSAPPAAESGSRLESVMTEPVLSPVDTEPATPPAGAGKVTKPARALVAVFPSYPRATAGAQLASQTATWDPSRSELLALKFFAVEPPPVHQPTTQPPTAWKSATVSSVLRSVLPPIDVELATAPTRVPSSDTIATQLSTPPLPAMSAAAAIAATSAVSAEPASAVTVAAGALVTRPEAAENAKAQPLVEAEPGVGAPRAWAFPVSTPVADTRARLPGSRPAVESASATSAARPRPSAAASPAQLGSAQQPSARRSSVRRRVLILALLLALAIAALFRAAASSSLFGWLPDGDFLGNAAALVATPGVTQPVAPPPTSPGAARDAGAVAIAAPSPARPAPPTSIPTPAPPVATPRRTHVVHSGETLVSIAARFGVTPQSIRRLNHIKDPNLIHVGQRLVIPAPQ